MGDSESISPERPIGNSYEYIKATDSARMHLGDTNYGDNVQNKVEINFSGGIKLDEDNLRQILEYEILDQLKFYGIDDRFEGIIEAHRMTFQWIFEKEDLGFVPWLKERHGIFWITGKAGSGKSTLTKFIYQDWRTRKLLKSDHPNLLIAGFFFHDRGTNPLLKNQIGLYRAILHQILTIHKALIPIVLSDRWEKLRSRKVLNQGSRPHTLDDLEWKIKELKQAFKAIVEQRMVKLHLFLIIDGLDEFSGSHDDLIATLNELLPEQNSTGVLVQLCLSSRPLLDFERAYKKQRHLAVQDLSTRDLEIYVKSKFDEVEALQDVMEMAHEQMEQLVSKILEKASGVFLWVYLVVRSLIEGIKSYDTMADLNRRLNDLPAGLQPLYARMIENIKPIYHDQAARLFRIVQYAAVPLSPLALSFIEEPPRIITDEALLERYRKGVTERVKITEVRLKARCAGLIEVTSHQKESMVQFLHLTVKEYLKTPAMEEWLSLRTATAAFIPDDRITSSCLRQLQITNSVHMYHFTRGHTASGGELSISCRMGLIYMIVNHARRAELSRCVSMLPYLSALDTLISGLRSKFDEDQSWVTKRYAEWKESEIWQSDLVSYMVTLGMTRSVTEAIENGYEVGRKPGRPLIFYVLPIEPSSAGTKQFERSVLDPGMIEVLFQNGGDPYEKYDGIEAEYRDSKLRTPWEGLMLYLQKYLLKDISHINLDDTREYYDASTDASSQRLLLQWLKAVQIFLKYNADIGDPKNVISKSKSTLQIYDGVFKVLNDPLVAEIRALLSTKSSDRALLSGREDRKSLTGFQAKHAHYAGGDSTEAGNLSVPLSRGHQTRAISPLGHSPAFSPRPSEDMQDPSEYLITQRKDEMILNSRSEKKSLHARVRKFFHRET